MNYRLPYNGIIAIDSVIVMRLAPAKTIAIMGDIAVWNISKKAGNKK